MRVLGIEDCFPNAAGAPRFGGFGSDYCSGDTEESWRDRGELVRIARTKAESATGGKSMEVVD